SLVAAGQPGVVAWILEALRNRARELRHPGAHAKGQRALVRDGHRQQRTHALRPAPLLKDHGAGMHDSRLQTDAGTRVLLADIGGTNARFALADPHAGLPLLSDSVRRYEVAAFASLGDAA